MSGSLTLKGTLTVDAQGSAIGCPPSKMPDRHVVGLSFRDCLEKHFQSIVETAVPLRLQTSGSPGDAFEDLDLLADFTAIELLYLRSDSRIIARIDAAAARLVGSSGTFPTGFSGDETLDLEIDGTAFTTTFEAEDQSISEVIARINSAAALAGLATPRAEQDAATSQLAIEGIETGSAGAVKVTGGTGASTLGFADTPSAVGDGEDVPVFGTLLAELGREPDVPSRVQLSGNANITVVAAGRTAA